MAPLSNFRFKPLVLRIALWLAGLALIGGVVELAALWARPQHPFVARQHDNITLAGQPITQSQPFGDSSGVGRITTRTGPMRYDHERDITQAQVDYVCFNATGITSSGAWEFEFPGEPLKLTTKLSTNLEAVVEQYFSVVAYYGDSLRVIVNRLDTDGSVLSVSRTLLPLDPMYAGAIFEHHFVAFAGEIDTDTYKQRCIAFGINLSQHPRQYLEKLKAGTLPENPRPEDMPAMRQPYGVVFVKEQQAEWAEPFDVVPMPGNTKLYSAFPYGWSCLYMLSGGGNHGWYSLRDEEAPEAPDYTALVDDYLATQPDGFVLPEELASLPKRPHALLADSEGLPDGYATVLETYLKAREEYYLSYADDSHNILYLLNSHNRRFDNVLPAFEHDEANSTYAQIRVNFGYGTPVPAPASSSRAVAISFNTIAGIPEALTYAAETDVRPPFIWRMEPEGGNFIELPVVPAEFYSYHRANQLLGFTSKNKDGTAMQFVQPGLLAAPELVWWSGETAPGAGLKYFAGNVLGRGDKACVAFIGTDNNLVVLGEDGQVLLNQKAQPLLPLELNPVELDIPGHGSTDTPSTTIWFSAASGGEKLLLSLTANPLYIAGWEQIRSAIWLVLGIVLLGSILYATLRFRHQAELSVVFLLVDGVRSNQLLAEAGNRHGGSLIRRILRRFRHYVRQHFPVLINKYEGDGLKLLVARPPLLATVMPPVLAALRRINNSRADGRHLHFRLLASVCHATIYPSVFRQADFASREIGVQCHLESLLKYRYPGRPFICLDWALYTALPEKLQEEHTWHEMEVELPTSDKPLRIAVLFFSNPGLIESVLPLSKASS